MCWKTGVLILLGLLLAACGNKGPLVLPDVGAEDKVESDPVRSVDQNLTNKPKDLFKRVERELTN